MVSMNQIESFCRRIGDDFMRQILEEGKVLYEADGGTPVDCR